MNLQHSFILISLQIFHKAIEKIFTMEVQNYKNKHSRFFNKVLSFPGDVINKSIGILFIFPVSSLKEKLKYTNHKNVFLNPTTVPINNSNMLY